MAPGVTSDRALYDVIRFIRPLHRALAASVKTGLQRTGITLGLRAVMEIVDASGPQTVPAIGRVLEIRRQPVQRVVTDAVERGLLQLIPNPAHRRSNLVALTDAGRDAFSQIRAREQSVLQPIAERLTDEEIGTCVRVLHELMTAFQERADEGR